MSLNIYEMSDEEISKLTPAQIEEASQAESDASSEVDDEGADNDEVSEDTDGDSADAKEDAQEVEETDSPEEEEDFTEDSDEELIERQKREAKEAKAAAKAGKTQAQTTSDEGTEAADKTDETKPAEGDGDTTPAAKTEENPMLALTGEEAQSTVAKLFAPFRANGKDIQVKSVDDAVALMQMGANYSQKMTGLKPHMAMLKLLEKNDLLDTSKINYLIDIHQKNPDAINKLIKDSGIDPMDIDGEKSNDYSPTNRTVTDNELVMDEVLAELKTSDNYDKILDTVGTKWDKPSLTHFSSNPRALKVLDEHMKYGYFDMIQDEVSNERMMGRLTGLSDVQAYEQVGDKLYREGKFNTPEQLATAKSTPVVIKETLKTKSQKQDPETIARRKKVSATRSNPGSSGKQLINPFDLSDEEFEKMGGIQSLKG